MSGILVVGVSKIFSIFPPIFSSKVELVNQERLGLFSGGKPFLPSLTSAPAETEIKATSTEKAIYGEYLLEGDKVEPEVNLNIIIRF